MKAILFALLLCFSVPASAMSLTPLGQTLDSSTSTGTLRIRNDNKGEKRYQIVVDAWTVGANGEKIQTPTSNLTFYPSSVITLGPGKIQTLRWKRTGANASREQVYLIQVREIPLDDADSIVSSQGVQLKISPTMKFPWLFAPKGATAQLSAHQDSQSLVLENRGSSSARISKISYAGIPDPGPQLVLPGERLHVKASTSASQVTFDLLGVALTLPVE